MLDFILAVMTLISFGALALVSFALSAAGLAMFLIGRPDKDH